MSDYLCKLILGAYFVHTSPSCLSSACRISNMVNYCSLNSNPPVKLCSEIKCTSRLCYLVAQWRVQTQWSAPFSHNVRMFLILVQLWGVKTGTLTLGGNKVHHRNSSVRPGRFISPHKLCWISWSERLPASTADFCRWKLHTKHVI